VRAGTKKAQVIRMLQRSNGASIAEITRVAQWQPHTVRALISRALVHDLGLKVARFKRDQARGSRSLHQPGGARPSGRTVAHVSPGSPLEWPTWCHVGQTLHRSQDCA